MSKYFVGEFEESNSIQEYRSIKITSKRQLTIPKTFFDSLELRESVQAYLLPDAIVLKPAHEKKTVQQEDIEQIVKNVLDEGYIADELADEIARRVKEYNQFLDKKINKFIDEMNEVELPDEQGDAAHNGLDIFFDTKDTKNSKKN